MIKKLILSIVILLFTNLALAQSYEALWNKVNDLESEPNYKKAFKIIKKIEQKAEKENHEVQQIKSLLYTASYQNVWVENYENTFFKDLNKKIKKANTPYANWLNYIGAKVLFDYYNTNQYKISSLKTTNTEFSEDLRTWDQNQFKKQIGIYLENSIANPTELEKLKLIDFEEIIVLGDEIQINNERNLYDFFATNYHTFYLISKKRDSKSITNSIINSYPKKAFWRENLEAKLWIDSIKNNTKTEKLFDYINEISTHFSQNYIQEKYKLSLLSKVYNREINNTKTTHLPKLISEFKKLEKSKYQEIHKSATSKINHITNFDAALNFDYKIVSNHPFIGTLNFKNTTKVYIDIFKKDKNTKITTIDSLYKNQTVYKNVEVPLKQNHYHTHKTKEIKFPALPVGEFIIVVKNKENQILNKEYIVENITVSDLYLISFREKDTYNFQVLNGKNGNINKDAVLMCNNKVIVPNKNNLYTVPTSDKLEIKTWAGNDTINKTIRNYYNKTADLDKSNKISLFTDRNLYEPGEQIQFKLIAVNQNKDVAETVANQKIWVNLHNTNDKIVDSLEITTNDFGSASGTFKLPNQGLNGNYNLNAKWKNQSFSTNFKVENIKIPTFKISIDPIISPLDPSSKCITLTGNAITFAGNPLQNVEGFYYIKSENNEDEDFEDEKYEDNEDENELNKEIKTEKTKFSFKTDKEGKFTITFPIEFNTIDENNNNYYFKPEVINYTLDIEIKDTTGETQTKKFGFKTSPKQFYANTNSYFDEKNELNLYVYSKDINDVNINTEARVQIFNIKSNTANKFVNRANTSTIDDRISENEFNQIYPETEYNSEIEKNKWEILAKVYDKKINCDGEFHFDSNSFKHLKSGWYKIVSDYKTSDLKQSDTLYVYKKEVNANKASLKYLEKQIVKDKNQFKVIYNSTFKNFIVQQIIYVDQEIISTKTIELNSGKNEFVINTNLKPEQTITVFTYGVKNNNEFNLKESYTESIEKEKSEISIKSFRNKLEPNTLETWDLTILTSDSNKNFEVLAAMHNKALDKIYSSYWYTNLKEYYSNKIYHTVAMDKNYYRNYRYINNLNPTKNNNLYFPNYKTDIFNWFNFNINTYHFKNETRNEFKNKTNLKTFEISGIVEDTDNLPITGVSIYLKNKNVGTQTDIDGNFKLNVSIDDTIIFSYIGFQTQEFKVKPYKTYNIILDSDQNSLDEIVVTGYSNDQVKYTSPEVNMTDKLQGQVAGLNIKNAKVKGDSNSIGIRGTSSKNNTEIKYIIDGKTVSEQEFKQLKETEIHSIEVIGNTINIVTLKTAKRLQQIQAKETKEYSGIFIPHAKTNAKGQLNLQFTTPKTSASWIVRLLAHNQQANSVFLKKEILTQKKFMVQPNWPNFAKQQETLFLQSKIVNLDTKKTSVKAQLQILDAKTKKDITNSYKIDNAIQDFEIEANSTTNATWKLNIPSNAKNCILKIVAYNETNSDGEQIFLPIVPNQLILETAEPIWLNPTQSKTIITNNSTNQITQLQVTNNVNAIALQAIPYILKLKCYTSTELFDKIYAQILGNYLIENNNELKEKIKQINPETLTYLKQNNPEEISQTPWLKESDMEQNQLENLALYLNPITIETQILEDLKELKTYKTETGFTWIKNGISDNQITLNIIKGLGEAKLNTNNKNIQTEIDSIATAFFKIWDKKMEDNKAKLQNPIINELDYYYARSFYPNLKTSTSLKNKINKYYQKLENSKTLSIQQKPTAAILLYRNNRTKAAQKIIKQLEQSSVLDQTKGMYFKENNNTNSFNQNSIYTQAQIIKAFKLITNNQNTINNLISALVYNKQANYWENSYQTVQAISAIINNKKQKDSYTVKIDDIAIQPTHDFYNNITVNLNPNQKVEINNTSTSPLFGGIYTKQVIETQNIKTSTNPEVQIKREYFLTNKDQIKPTTKYKTGDIITIKLTITTNQPTNYLIITDQRIAHATPQEQISKYINKNGIYYYQTNTVDATNFHIPQLQKGTHIIEYQIRATHNGQANTGITTLKSMYAPQIKANTNNQIITIKD